MIVYRLTREKYCLDLSGKGAYLIGGRWNSKGVHVLYTAANRSLAMAEVAVHLNFAYLPDDYYMVEIFVPDNAPLLKISEYELPEYWNSIRFNQYKLKKNGDNFIKENKYLSMQVPSVVTKGDYNILLNPAHALFDKVKVINMEKFPFDHRMFE